MNIIYRDTLFLVHPDTIAKGSFIDTVGKYDRNSLQLCKYAKTRLYLDDIEAVSVDDMYNYLLLLQLEDFESSAGVYKMLEIDLNIVNRQEFPHVFYDIKLMDDMIRSRFYGLDLCSTSAEFGLIDGGDKLKVNATEINDVMKIVKGRAIVAGGCMTHKLTLKSDIDVFPVNISKQEADDLVKELMLATISVGDEQWVVREVSITPHATSILYSFYLDETSTHGVFSRSWGRRLTVQVIHRIYSCISEVLHGFDIPACSIGYDGKNIWMTKSCRYSLDNSIIYFDMDRKSPSYVYRLAKYHTRGYQLVIPLFNARRIDKLKLLNAVTGRMFTFEDVKSQQLKITEWGHEFTGDQNDPDNDSNEEITLMYTGKAKDIILDRFCKRELSLHFTREWKNLFWIGDVPQLDDKGVQKTRQVLEHEAYVASRRHFNASLTQQNILFMAVLWDMYPGTYLVKEEFTSDYGGNNGIFLTNDYGYAGLMISGETAGVKMNLKMNRLTVRVFFGFEHTHKGMMKLLNAWNPVSKKMKEFYDSVAWMTTDPMKQLNGSFNPETIDDLVQWYKDSKVYLDKPYEL